LKTKADELRRFLDAWFEAVAFMDDHKAETVAIGERVLNTPKSIVGRAYDAYKPHFSRSGRFESEGLSLLSQSFIDLGMLPSAPQMSNLYTESLLPSRH
jgi:ABC-type nitrate/sulfonate/bicarbonate transport system substrate-binding protein